MIHTLSHFLATSPWWTTAGMARLALPWALGLAPLAFMIFWLVRVRIGSRFKQEFAVLPAE